jgi:prolyl-tRNA editing enzyme YbaK/EbsC (Cys-tRNA(Pro) deacylase)
VDALLAEAGAAGRVQLLSAAAPTAAAAAELVGVEVGAIANSLVFATAEHTPLLVLTSGAHRVDTAKVADLVGTAKLSRATPDFVYAATGQRIGGVAPLGHPRPLRTLIDVALALYPQVWAAGGIPHAVFPTTFAELVRLTGGTPAEVA